MQTTAQFTPEVVTVGDDQPHHAKEHDQEDHPMPPSMELGPRSPQSESETAQEPNFDVHVAALQLQDCDKN